MVQQAYPPFWVSSSGFRGFVAKRDNISGWEMFDQSYQKTKQLPLSLGRIFGVRIIFAEMESSSCWRGLWTIPTTPQTTSEEPDQLFAKNPAESTGITTPAGPAEAPWLSLTWMPCSLPRLSRAMPRWPSSSETLFAPLCLKPPSSHCTVRETSLLFGTQLESILPSWRKPLSPSCLRFQCSCEINMLGLMFFPWLLKGQNGSVLNLQTHWSHSSASSLESINIPDTGSKREKKPSSMNLNQLAGTKKCRFLWKNKKWKTPGLIILSLKCQRVKLSFMMMFCID